MSRALRSDWIFNIYFSLIKKAVVNFGGTWQVFEIILLSTKLYLSGVGSRKRDRDVI